MMAHLLIKSPPRCVQYSYRTMATMKALLTAPGPKASLVDVPVPKCGPKDILVAVKTVASNPTDWKKLARDPEMGVVMGCDFAGKVEEIGSEVPDSTLKKGDRVASFLHGGTSKELGGTFAEYILADPDLCVLLPDTLTDEDAAGIGISAFTACQVLFQKRPEVTPLKPAPGNKPILIWGGATALGLYAMQLAKLAGYNVIATASPTNFNLVKSFGASAVFDYRDSSVSQKIREHTHDKLDFAVDCISEGATPRQVSDSLGSQGGTVNFVLAVDKATSGVRDEVNADIYLVYKLVGKEWFKPYHWPANAEYHEDGKTFAKLLSQLFAEGKLKAPPIKILPRGLASIPEGLEMTQSGKVRGVKLTYRVADTLL